MYEYDNTILSNISYPDKWTNTDITNFINKLIFDTAELEILYPEPDIMKTAIKYWSAANVSNWNKLYDTTVLDYNPIWNKDGTITESETIGRTHSNTNAETTSTEQNANSSDNSTEKDYAFSYNSNTAHQANQIENESESSGTVKSSGSTNSNGSGSDNETRQYTRKETGNIGITTTQQMINEEREVDKFNLTDYIINEFKKTFCLMVY